MDINKYIEIPIIIAVVLLCVSFYTVSLNIENSDLSTFLGKAQTMKEKAENIKDTFSNQTSENMVVKFIEEIPVFGTVVKAGRFLANIIDTVRSGLDIFLTFLTDALSSEVIGVPVEIITLLIASFFIGFGLAVYRALRESA